MAETTRLYSNNTTIFLNGAHTPYNGSGTPWDTQATTPFLLSLNDVTGAIWTPSPAPSVPIYGGGPPFRPSRTLISKSYDTVTETVGLQIYATSHDNAVALLRMLRRELNTALFSSPCILSVQPDGATNDVVSEIYHADVVESPKYIEEKRTGAFLFRAQITWTRSIGFRRGMAGIISSVTVQNRSSGSPDNLESLGSLDGDLIYEGQPLNISINPTTSSDINDTTYIAVVYDRVNTSVVDTRTTTTSINFNTASPAVTAATDRVLKIRILARLDTFTAPSKIRLRCDVYGGGSGSILFKSSPTLSLPAATATSTLLDFGYVDIRPFRTMTSVNTSLVAQIVLSSSDGTSVTARLDYIETLMYYTFAKITGSVLGSVTGEKLFIEGANNYNVNPTPGIVTPNPTPRVYVVPMVGGDATRNPPWRGTLPRAYSGASLYLAWLGGATANTAHDTTDTAVVIAQHLPLYHTLAGNG